MKLKSLIIFAFIFTVGVSSSVAAVVSDNTSKSDLEAAISQAGDGELIKFNFNGTDVRMTGSITIKDIGKSITIDGLNQSNNLPVVLKAEKHRIFTISGKTTNVTFKNIIFVNADNNAVKITAGATVNFDNCTFADNNLHATTADVDGALSIASSMSTINRCTFQNNSTNSVNGGGAITIHGGSDVFISYSNFEENSIGVNNTGILNAASGGGAVAIIDDATVDINICRFNKNYAPNGGAIMIKGKTHLVNITNSSFIENTAARCATDNNIHYGGGAMVVYTTADNKATSRDNNLYIANCTFANNVSYHRGGAIYFRGEALSSANAALTVNSQLVNNTFVGNVSGVAKGYNSNLATGGAIYFKKAGTTYKTTHKSVFVNNLFANNYTIKSVALSKRKTFTDNEIDAVSNIFGAYDDVLASRDGNYNPQNDLFDFGSIFSLEASNPIYQHLYTAMLSGLPEIASLSGNTSFAYGKGISAYNSVEIPKTDATGATRPIYPAIGAVEPYSISTDVEDSLAKKELLQYSENKIVSSGLLTSKQIFVYDVCGKLVMKSTLSDETPLIVDCLTDGIYIAKMESSVLKFIK